MSLQKESEWEKEFDENFEWFIKLGESQLETSDTPNIKAFIQETLSNREKEIAEEVEKKSFRGFAPYEQHYLIKKGDVLSILKH